MQQISDKVWQAEARTEETKRFIRDIKRVTRRRFTAEEKVRIVLEGFRRGTPIRDLCRREGIRPSTYYAWLKDFMEARKERLERDTVRDATRAEIQELKRENESLKQLVAELSLGMHVLKKNGRTGSGIKARCVRESAAKKRDILALIRGSGLPRRRALAQLGLAKSTYYWWLKRQAQGSLQDRKGGSATPWNRLRPEEGEKILAQARASPERLSIIVVDSIRVPCHALRPSFRRPVCGI